MNESTSIWLAGARPNTLPAAIAPVLAGVASAMPGQHGHIRWGAVLLCAVVALALQVGVNFANDYSDGVRGTDDQRVGPVRLTASGLATPEAVRRAAFICFGIAAVAGAVAVLLSEEWWLIAVGVLAILAAWFYTGGKNPYGYRGLGEVAVFVFFGLVATVGTAQVAAMPLVGTLPDGTPGWFPPASDAHTWYAAVAMGCLASALLVVNNLRDIPSDRAAGKRTLATRLGDAGTRYFYVGLVLAAVVATILFAVETHPSSFIALLGFLVLVEPIIRLLRGASGRALIPLLRATGLAELGVALGLVVGVFLGE